MKESFKIEKELLFKHNIKDITSISLDREYKVDNNVVTGNFLINGEYKVHELSINKEKFNFKIPFKYELEKDINEDSVEVEIINFIYDNNRDELIVNIEYEINAYKKEVLEKEVLEFDTVESLDEFLQNREVDIINMREENKEDEVELIPNINESRNIESLLEKNIPIMNKEENIHLETKEESINANEIVNNFSIKDNNFITYKVYKLSEMDTIESVVMKFHTTIDELKEYNDLTNLITNSKIIVPVHE